MALCHSHHGGQLLKHAYKLGHFVNGVSTEPRKWVFGNNECWWLELELLELPVGAGHWQRATHMHVYVLPFCEGDCPYTGDTIPNFFSTGKVRSASCSW